MGKRALCVGLNYPNQEYQLYGCVNDCLDWERLLKETYEFEETRVLIDQYPDSTPTESGAQLPTRANILGQLGGWLVSGAQPGDVLVFVFAGHGCQVRTGQSEAEEALVPTDYRDSSNLITRDEVHALLARLPSGCYVTLIMDCCHGAHMLDVPCSVDTSTAPFAVHQTTDHPQEVSGRNHEAWMQAYVDHARSRPRFLPTVASAPRPKRSPEGAGAHVGRMTLNPGVTAFCLAAARPFENARDANIKSYQCGVLTFCLHQALQDLQYRCTFEQLLERAAWKMDDIRNKYMRMMDQTIQMSFCPNSAPSAVVVFDARYAPVAQHRISQLAQQRNMSPPDNLRSPGAPTPQPVREASTEFVPSPAYHVPPDTNAAGEVVGVGIVYVQLFSCSNLRPMGMYGQCDPYVKLTCGGVTHQSTVKRNSTNPAWNEEENKFTFKASDCQVEMLHMEVRNAGRDELIGGVDVPLRSLPSMAWEERRQFLQNGGEVEFRVALYPERAAANLRPQPGMAPALPMPGHMGPMEPAPGAYTERPRPPSPPARDLGPSLMGDFDFRTPMERRPADEEPLLDNIFGKPNLFAAMPDLMSQLSKDASAGFHEVLPAIPNVGGLAAPSLGGLSTPVSGLPAAAPVAAPVVPGGAPAGTTTSRLGAASYTPPPASFTPPSLMPTAEVGRTASRGMSLEGYYSTGGVASSTMHTASPLPMQAPQVTGRYTYSTSASPFTYSQGQPAQSALGSDFSTAAYSYTASAATPFTGYSQLGQMGGQTAKLGADLGGASYTYTAAAAPALTGYSQQGQMIGQATSALGSDLNAYTYTTSPSSLFTGFSQPGQSTGVYGGALTTPSYQPQYQVLS